MIIPTSHSKVSDFKAGLQEILLERDLEVFFSRLEGLPARKAINPVISCFYHGNPLLRWRAISAFGFLVGKRIAEEDLERARILMRRMMWSLNDESGGIGWGAPEAMAEAMANNPALADEYCRILLSYIWEEGNFLEHDPLRLGALWGVARVAEVHPRLMKEAAAFERVEPYLDDPDPAAVACAIWAASQVASRQACETVGRYRKDTRQVELYRRHRLSPTALGTLAAEALDRLGCNG